MVPERVVAESPEGQMELVLKRKSSSEQGTELMRFEWTHLAALWICDVYANSFPVEGEGDIIALDFVFNYLVNDSQL